MKVTTSSSTSTHEAALGKANCCVCGKEVGLLGRYQLGDYNEICKPCFKLASAFYNGREALVEKADAAIAAVIQ